MTVHWSSLLLSLVFLQVNAVNCNTSWKVTLFMKFSDYREDVLKGVSVFILPLLHAVRLMSFSADRVLNANVVDGGALCFR